MIENEIMGWMLPDDLNALSHLAKMVPSGGIIVEVGSMFGKSAVSWATYSNASKIYCVDTFLEDYNVIHDIPDEICEELNFPISGVTHNILKIFTENTKSYSNIIPIRGYSPGNIVIPEEKIDLFFLDASHTNPNDWENIQYFLPMIKVGGIISGHDYDSILFPDVVENVARLKEMMKGDVSLYKDSTVWSITVTGHGEFIE
jgi:predicted O-methyltransferase YrrM